MTVEVTGDRLTATWTDGRHDEFVLGELFDT